MTHAFAATDQFLRGQGPFGPLGARERPWWWLPAMVLLFAPLYGLVMGSFSVTAMDRMWLSVFAAVKVPLLLLVSSLVCLPWFFVLNTVLGLRDDFRAALQAILAGQTALSIALAALGPITLVWYASEASYRAALLFNAAAFAVATGAGQIAMLRDYRVLIRRDGRHRIGLAAWVLLYAFVGIQMGWMLRPFIGNPSDPPQFFRPEPFSNAYVVVARLFVGP
jgi:hypothetical protein